MLPAGMTDLAMRIHFIFGFLGSGKTTLLRHLLRTPSPDGPTAVIVNEFGAVGIDGSILKGEHVDILEYSSGCFCCSLKGALIDGLRELRRERRIARVLVEASGVAQAEELMAPVRAEAEALSIIVGPSIAVFDAARYDHLSSMLGEFLEQQIKQADVVLLNKIDLVSAEHAEAIRQKVAELGQGVPVFCASHGEMDAALLLQTAVFQAWPAPKGHGDHRLPSGVSSVVLAADASLRQPAAERFFHGLSPTVWRAKGYLRVDGTSMLAQYVPGQLALSVADTTPEHHQLVVIGRGMDPTEITRDFAAASVALDP